jgi:uncharacterized protein YciI
MLFLLRLTNHPDTDELRATHLAAHRAFLDGLGDRIVAAGNTTTPDGQPGLGGIWIVRAPDAEAALALTEDDPFFKVGMRASREVFAFDGRPVS